MKTKNSGSTCVIHDPHYLVHGRDQDSKTRKECAQKIEVDIVIGVEKYPKYHWDLNRETVNSTVIGLQ